MIPPLETLPPGDQSGVVVYLGLFCLQRKHLTLWVFLNISFLRRGVVSTSSNLQAGGPPLDGCPRMLMKFIHSYPPYWRPFLHPQPEDAPCRGDSLKYNRPYKGFKGRGVGQPSSETFNCAAILQSEERLVVIFIGAFTKLFKGILTSSCLLDSMEYLGSYCSRYS